MDFHKFSKYLFNNCDSSTNGEEKFFNKIKDRCNIVFDVGSRSDSILTRFKGEVHYFEPVQTFLDALKVQPTLNTKSVFNNFGLGSEEKELWYYPKYQSFINRTESCKIDDSNNKILLRIKYGESYIN